MTRVGSWVGGVLAIGLVGCGGAWPPAVSWAIGPPPGASSAGAVAGRVFAWRDERFAPLPAAAITIDGAATGEVTDERGAFRCVGLAAGPHQVAVMAVGFEAVAVTVEAIAGSGAGRLALLAFPAGGASAARGDRRIVGVVTNPWGGALPGATVHCVDSASGGGAGGNRRWTANADGLFTGLLTDMSGDGTATFMAYGRLDDGRAAEGRFRHTVALAGGGVVGVAVATHVIAGGEGSVKPASR